MTSLVATTSTPARKPFMRTQYVRTNNAKFSGHYVCPRTHYVRTKRRRIMPSLVATMSAFARITCVRTHYVRTNKPRLKHTWAKIVNIIMPGLISTERFNKNWLVSFRMSFFPPMFGAGKRILPSGVKEKHTLLRPSISRQHDFL